MELIYIAMEWGINDSLKARSYGQKSDYGEKLEKISQNGGKYPQYYPQKSDGNIDEWEAINRQQQESIKKVDEEVLKTNNEQK